MNIDKYLYEIFDDYKNADTDDERIEIFNNFCSYLWSCNNKRRVYIKQIKFKVRNDLLESEIGQVFNAWSEVEYIGYKSMTKDDDWCNLLRQKINNLYTKYFDSEVILNKEYMDLLRTPKKLYYRWINGEEMNVNELTESIDNAINYANELKKVYQKQKMELSWSDYKSCIEKYLRNAFNSCELIEDYEDKTKLLNIYDMSNEDNSYVSYICRCLEGKLLNYQKEYYELKRGRNKRYKRCKQCGNLIEDTGNKKMYCSKCATERKKKSNEISDKKYKNKKRENRKLQKTL